MRTSAILSPLLVLLLAACQLPTPTGTPTSVPTMTPGLTLTRTVTPTSVPTATLTATDTQTTSATPTSTPVSFLDVTPALQELPAGSSAQFRLDADPSCQEHRYSFGVDELPVGWTAEFLGSPTPCDETLVVHVAGSALPGRYRIGVSATSDTGSSASAQLFLDVIPCVEFQPGEFTQAVQSNLVLLITAGKPSIEHGLLIPLQVCGSQPRRRLRVTLLEVMSEAGSPMSAPPRFYLYRSWVWPAPDHIVAHGAPGAVNVQVPRINNEGWQLEVDLPPGLYLLVFERDYYGASPDPQAIPASVNYRLEMLP